MKRSPQSALIESDQKSPAAFARMSDNQQRNASSNGTKKCDQSEFGAFLAASRQAHSGLSAILIEPTSHMSRNKPDEVEIKALVSLSRKHKHRDK